MATENQKIAAQLADQLTEGFIALSAESRHLASQRHQLEKQLARAKHQYLDLLKRNNPEIAAKEHQEFLQSLEEAAALATNEGADWLESLLEDKDQERRSNAYLIKQAELAYEKLQAHAKEAEGVKIWNGPSADGELVTGSVTGRSRVGSAFTLERDFTVPGTPSKLGCPFAKPSILKSEGSRRHSLATPRSSTSRLSPRALRSKRSSFNDPIRAEICGNDPPQSTPSVEEPVPVCPIRFLDQHPPEEIAKYFENHKHEIPRSHEVCIKRFQSNSESIRQLDAKYGNLVSMIQGLGEKHQPMLQEKLSELDDNAEAGDANDMVKNWAEAVSESLPEGQPLEEQITEKETIADSRTPHFDRPLKEIRVGESPSRPWGITVPLRYMKAESILSGKSGNTASPLDQPKVDEPIAQTKPSGCPFDHSRLNIKPVHNEVPTLQEPLPLPPQPHEEQKVPLQPSPPVLSPAQIKESPKAAPTMVFNGPVFIGYPPDQISVFLQQSGLGRST